MAGPGMRWNSEFSLAHQLPGIPERARNASGPISDREGWVIYIIRIPKDYGMLGGYDYIIARLYTDPEYRHHPGNIFSYIKIRGWSAIYAFIWRTFVLCPGFFWGRTIYRL
jgi:hypothetical protein